MMSKLFLISYLFIHWISIQLRRFLWNWKYKWERIITYKIYTLISKGFWKLNWCIWVIKQKITSNPVIFLYLIIQMQKYKNIIILSYNNIFKLINYHSSISFNSFMISFYYIFLYHDHNFINYISFLSKCCRNI